MQGIIFIFETKNSLYINDQFKGNKSPDKK